MTKMFIILEDGKIIKGNTRTKQENIKRYLSTGKGILYSEMPLPKELQGLLDTLATDINSNPDDTKENEMTLMSINTISDNIQLSRFCKTMVDTGKKFGLFKSSDKPSDNIDMKIDKEYNTTVQVKTIDDIINNQGILDIMLLDKGKTVVAKFKSEPGLNSLINIKDAPLDKLCFILNTQFGTNYVYDDTANITKIVSIHDYINFMRDNEIFAISKGNDTVYVSSKHVHYTLEELEEDFDIKMVILEGDPNAK